MTQEIKGDGLPGGVDGSLRSPTFRVLDLFSGIGGFALAFEAAGFRTVAFAEIEPYPCKVLKQHWPEVPNLGDVRGINGEDYRGAVDVVCGGFPCQDISLAGKGAGITGARSGLWSEMLRIIRGARPAFCLLENVPALKSRGADTVLGDLEEAGYTGRAFVVGAVHAGANHRRQRAWIVAYASGRGWNGRQDHQQGEGIPDQPERRRAGSEPEVLADTEGFGRTQWRAESEGKQGGPSAPCGGPFLADTEGQPIGPGLCQDEPGGLWRGRPGDGSSAGVLSNARREGLEVRDWTPGQRPHAAITGSGWWATEPALGRVAHGVPNRAHRIKALGNSIVPAVAYPFALWIGMQLRREASVSGLPANRQDPTVTSQFPPTPERTER